MTTEDKSLLAGYMSRDAVSAELGVSKLTLINYGKLPDGLPSVRIGARIYYRRADVEAFIDRRFVQKNITRENNKALRRSA